MTGRHKRPATVSATAFLKDAEAMHKTLNGYCMKVRVGSEHYTAINKLHMHLIETIKVVTGKDAPWISRTNSGPSSGEARRP
ncbi:MAG TPA: hypothetical protein VMF90_16780 [Rhizobiaceae bacterium]|nr:hypothetical protein [Rhizobiaceae bacterium]